MDIYREIRSALSLEERVVVATIVSASGSTPAPLLSKMLITHQGSVGIGTIGGGCMEGDILLRAPRVYESGIAELLQFALEEDDHGMICGGTIEVLVEPVSRAAVPAYDALIRHRDLGESCALVTLLDADMRVREKSVAAGPEEMARLPGGTSRHPQAEQGSFQQRTADGLVIVEPVEGAAPLILFGGGHISRAISRVASLTGFRTTIVDDRPKYAHRNRFPEAAEIVVADFTDVADLVRVKHKPYVLIVTRGHRHDEAILRQVLTTETGFVGMIGSRRKVLTTYQRLLDAGVGMEQLRRVHAPMGLEIGAVSPEEIAISVVAEMIATRRGTAGDRFPHMSEALWETLNARSR